MSITRPTLAVSLVTLLACVAGTRADDGAAPELSRTLRAHVLALTGTPQPRSYQSMRSLNATADYIAAQLKSAGIETTAQEYTVRGKSFRNLIGRIDAGTPKRALLGAHYDVWGLGPGADDNASGIAGLIELARLLKSREASLRHSVEIIAYTNEEPPFFATAQMGSYIHAQSVRRQKDEIAYMMVLEMIGYYSSQAGSQSYPLDAMRQLYPSSGNFIAIVGNMTSAQQVVRIRDAVRQHAAIGCESLIAPPGLQGVDFSDHRNYWDLGIEAVMVTDTAFYRNPHYHKRTDRPDTLDYDKMAEVVQGLAASFCVEPTP